MRLGLRFPSRRRRERELDEEIAAHHAMAAADRVAARAAAPDPGLYASLARR